jgi:hypothetical protein
MLIQLWMMKCKMRPSFFHGYGHTALSKTTQKDLVDVQLGKWTQPSLSLMRVCHIISDVSIRQQKGQTKRY